VPDLIPLQQAAQEFGVDPATLYRYLKAGRLTRYRRAMDVRTYLDRAQIKRLLKPRPVKG
jgi:predicted site-specific integrase-resolvase